MSSQKGFVQSFCNKSGAVELTGKEIDVIIGTNETVFINIYDSQYQWERNISFCREFDEIADFVRKTFPRRRKIVMAKVDRRKENSAQSQLTHCWGYASIIVFRNGQRIKQNYSFPSLKEYIVNELENPIKQLHDREKLENFDGMNHSIVGYFDREDMPEYDNFRRVAHNLKEYCQFYVKYGYSYNNETSKSMRPPNQPTIISNLGGTRSTDSRETFKGCVKDYDDLNLWAHKRCMVREMTFDNFEELKKDHSEMVILFHNPSNHTCVRDFRNVVGRTLMDQKHRLNCLTADGIKFGPYLREYGKNKKDLPIIMKENGIFENFKDIQTPGKLRIFALSYHYSRSAVSLEKFVKSMRKKIKS